MQEHAVSLENLSHENVLTFFVAHDQLPRMKICRKKVRQHVYAKTRAINSFYLTRLFLPLYNMVLFLLLQGYDGAMGFLDVAYF